MESLVATMARTVVSEVARALRVPHVRERGAVRRDARSCERGLAFATRWAKTERDRRALC
jgi:hypothetical protein